MKKFPHIKWYQNDTNIFITILENGDNFKITNENVILSYSDDIYEFNLELCDEFMIKNIKKNKNNVLLEINKINIIEWNSLLKDRNLYKYFISPDWNKFYIQEKKKNSIKKKFSNNKLFDEEEFKYLLESGELDKISSDSETETNSEEETN
tara:strand:+ start:108 stop:560 length:453 start_codon:yes stop_codon:yes gene_type:complete